MIILDIASLVWSSHMVVYWTFVINIIRPVSLPHGIGARQGVRVAPEFLKLL